MWLQNSLSIYFISIRFFCIKSIIYRVGGSVKCVLQDAVTDRILFLLPSFVSYRKMLLKDKKIFSL